MPWTYSQRTGELKRNGNLVGRGYSGRGAGKDNPVMQNARNLGPIPTGTYTIGAPFNHAHSGSYTMRLTPDAGVIMYGRSGFMIHGDSASRPGTASQGCIILRRDIRMRIWTSGDHSLEVTR
jgi:hypothetical protein